MPGYIFLLILGLLLLAGAACLYWGFFIEVRRVQTTSYELKVPDLPRAWQGRKILLFSDLHVGDGLPLDRLDYFLQLIIQEQPDLLLFAGDLSEAADFFASEESQAYLQHLASLKGLAPLGFYAVRGNHDTDSPAAEEFFDCALEVMGAEKLVNHGLVVDGLAIVGLDDHMYRQSDLAGALAQVKAAADPTWANLILLHEPDPAASYIQQSQFSEPTFFLAGHSHNGQIRPFGLHLYRARQGKDYPYGVYDFPQHQAQLVVSSGLGTVGIHARFAAAPEYVLLSFKA